MLSGLICYPWEKLGTFHIEVCNTQASQEKYVFCLFDCSAEFEGKSINQELLSGLDLTNQVVDV